MSIFHEDGFKNVDVIFNGQTREVADDATIASLLRELELDPRQCAVEVNLELAPRKQHAEYFLKPGDRIEVVTFVGGG